MGYLKKAFVLSFYFLLRHKNHLGSASDKQYAYRNAIRLTIQQGGDTDTNGCIVGGMMGALVGLTSIP